MTVRELIIALQAVDPNLIVWTQGDDEWQHYAQAVETEEDRLIIRAIPS
jgi:hypothetical protein